MPGPSPAGAMAPTCPPNALRRVAIDVTSAVHQSAGIGRYTRCLVEALAMEAPPFALTLFWTAGRQENIPAWLLQLSGVRLRRIPLPERQATIIWHRARVPLPVQVLIGPQDICHFPDFVLPPVLGSRTVVTVHDLSFRLFPQTADPGLRRYLNKVVPRSVRRADLVLADSNATKRDVVRHFDIAPEKVAVLYSGVGAEFRPVTQKAAQTAMRRTYGLPARFALSLGTLQPRKNYARLIEAYAFIRREESPDWDLVIVGRPGWLYEDLAKLVLRHQCQQHVHFVTTAADADLPTLYSMADVFVLASLYEGFGLPVLEAMACGVPVIASNVSSLPEVVGEAGLLVDPLDAIAIATALRSLMADETQRRRLRSAGLRQATKFSWEQAARELSEHYVRVWQWPR